MYNISFYNNFIAKENKTITDEDYINMVKYGTNQDAVLNGRVAKQQGNDDLYKKIKSQSMLVTPTGTFKSGDAKTEKNIELNGLCCIDIDTEVDDNTKHLLQADPYTYILHDSFGGVGICVFVKIDKEKTKDAYNAISKYYFDNYSIKADPSGKNLNRLRYLSFDPDIFINEKSKKFNVKIEKKDKLPTAVDYVYTQSDFDSILSQIKERSIDLCQEDYYRYIRIGMSLASEFGEGGRENFHFICSFGSKYNRKHTDRDYSGFLNGQDKITIGTFYYYCKEAGISIYSEKTRAIINRVKVSKSQGSPTVEGVVKNLKDGNNIEANDEDLNLIDRLINTNKDYSYLANEELTEIEQLANFIVDSYNPSRDAINKYKFINGKRMNDSTVDDIYLTCTKEFKDINVRKDDIRSILNSSLYVQTFNLLDDFIKENKHIKTNNAIDRVMECFDLDENTDKDYAKWAFTKWIVGAVHNWTSDENDTLVSPLVLVLCSSRMGSGKTYFFRTLMPEVLAPYYVEGKIDVLNKDSKLRLARSLIMNDDEFGGKSVKENEQFKSVTDINEIVERVPYGREDEVFKRRAILCGTSNEYNLLKDFTGKQRRILPINIKSINHDKYQKISKTELIIEAYNLLKDGFVWKLWEEHDVDYLYQNTQFNLDQLPVDDIFKLYFSFEENEEYCHQLVFNQGEIIDFFHRFTPHKFSRYDIKHIMDKNFQRIKPTKVNGKVKQGYKIYRKDVNNYEFPIEMERECPF